MTETAKTKTLPSRVTLKSIKVNQALSEETLCFSATVYLDGKKVGVAKNHGHGGDDFYHWDDAAAGAEVEKIGESYDKYGLAILIEDLIKRFEDEKVAKRNLKKGAPVTVFIKINDWTEGVTALPTQRQLPAVLAEHPGCDYRVVDLTVNTIAHETLKDFCLAYPRATKLAVWTETASIKDDTLVYVNSGVAHEFTDPAHKPSAKRMFEQYVAQQRALTASERALA